MHVFRLLGDPVRFRIVETLASGAHTAGELAAAVGGEFGISRTAVAHQLRTLRDAKFVTVHAEENVRSYRLTWNALDSVDRVLLDLFERWDARYGWPYTGDPMVTPPRRHRLKERTWKPSDRWTVEPLAPDRVGSWWDDDDPENEDGDHDPAAVAPG